MASALAISSRLIAASPARFSSWVSSSVSNDCNREVSAAPRSQIFSRTDQPEGRILREPLGIVDILIARHAAVDGLAQQVRQRKLGVLPRRESVRCWAMRSPKPRRSSNSRTRIRPPSEVTRDPWKSTFKEGLKES